MRTYSHFFPLFHYTTSLGVDQSSPVYFVPSNCPKCLGGGLILYEMIVQHLPQPQLEEERSLGIVVLHTTALALPGQKLAANLVPSLLLQVVGACMTCSPSFLDNFSRGVTGDVKQSARKEL